MIFEFLQSLLSDAPQWAKEQGLVKESIAISARYSRQKKSWAGHLQNCHQEIESFLSKHPTQKKIGILGSGYLLDFPPGILEDPSYELYLFDAVHPRSIRGRKTKAKLNLVTCDLNLDPEILNFDFQQELSSCELIVSTNLLSQLALSGSKKFEHKADLRSDLAQKLVAQHLKFLRGLKMPVLLISDFEKIFKSEEDKILVRESSLWNAKMPSPHREWLWQLAPLKEVSRFYSIELKVGAWLFES